MPNENLHPKSLKNIRQALGVGIFLLSGVLLVAPATHIWGLGFGVFYLFGISGYWGFLPFLLIIAAFLSVKGDISNRVISWRIYVGYVVFMLGLSTLLSHLSFNGGETINDIGLFTERLQAYEGVNHSAGLFFANELGGGLVGYALSALLLKGGTALLWTLAIGFMAVGFVLAFYSLLRKLVLSIARKISSSLAKSRARKETERLKEEAIATSGSDTVSADGAFEIGENKPSAGAALPNPDELPPLAYQKPTGLSAPKAEPVGTAGASDSSSLSRSDKYGQKPVSPLPQEIVSPIPLLTPSLSPREMARAGLQEAIFIPDGASFAPTPQEAKATVSQTPDKASSGVTPNLVASFVQKTTVLTPDAQQRKLSDGEASFVPSPSFDVPDFSDGKKAERSFSEESVSPSSKTVASADSSPVAEKAASLENAHVMMENVLDVGGEAPLKNNSGTIPSQKPAFSTPAQPARADVSSSSPVSSEPDAAQPKAGPRPTYKFPPIDLLTTYQDQGNLAEKQSECDHRSQLINQAMDDLHAGAHVVSYCIGPSVTRYDIQTDSDVSVSSIGKYVKDISVRLGGVSTRYEEVVRGKSTSGLEIANSTTTTVSLKEMVNALPKGEKNNLVIPFGKSISGEYVFADLSEFPHMLVAGTTGSGKSIFMHGVIMSLIMRNRPEDLKLVIVDPKRVEMGKYKDLPHLLCPIIKEPSQAKVCFQKLINEMERRYTLFELSSVSNIRQFNSEYAPEAGVEKLPFIVVVIDEYADLVDTCKDIGEGVVRLAQKARAAGIHLVIATQRPSVQVITGVIKANLPCRVALSMNNAIDSQTILGQGGAEELVGHGDMLVDCSQVARNGFTRCQGCFVNNNEIKAVSDFIRSEATVSYDPNFLDLVDHEAQEKEQSSVASFISKSEVRAAAGDDLYNTIKGDIMTKEYTSISKIQREYGVGFPRAGKIFARLQNEGIVASAPETQSSAKGCKVLVHEQAAPSNAGSTDQSSVTINPNGGNSL